MSNTRMDEDGQLQGQRPNSVLHIIDGFSYNKKGEGRDQRKWYKCSIKRCGGRLKVVNNVNHITVPHIHTPDLFMRERKMVLDNIKLLARTTDRPFKQIFEDETRNYPQIDPPLSYRQHLGMMNLARRKALPAIPNSLQEFCEMLSSPANVNQFGMVEAKRNDAGQEEPRQPFYRDLLVGITEAEGNTAVFASPTMLRLLQKASIILIDCTFKVIPRMLGLCQLLTIHVVIGDNTFCAVYALMTRRTTEAYARLFNYITTILVLNMSPTTILTDFDLSLQKAAGAAFPDSEVIGTYFHYGQAVWKKCQRLGLAPFYNAPDQPQTYGPQGFVKMVIALALLPADKIVEGVTTLEQLIDELEPEDARPILVELLKYIWRFWIGVVTVDRMSVLGQSHRTNNAAEAFNRNLLRRFVVSPNCWFFTQKLVQSDATESRQALLAQSGAQVRDRPKTEYVPHNKTVQAAITALKRDPDSLQAVVAFLDKMGQAFHTYFMRLERNLLLQSRREVDDDDDDRNDVAPADDGEQLAEAEAVMVVQQEAEVVVLVQQEAEAVVAVPAVPARRIVVLPRGRILPRGGEPAVAKVDAVDERVTVEVEIHDENECDLKCMS